MVVTAECGNIRANDLPSVASRAGKNLSFFFTFLRFLGFNLQMPDTKYDPQPKIRPCERHKSQFIFEYHLY